jgi:hypothetical protein
VRILLEQYGDVFGYDNDFAGFARITVYLILKLSFLHTDEFLSARAKRLLESQDLSFRAAL